MKREEGFIQTRGGKVWYEIVGDKNKTPLIVLHGGPGYPHDSLAPLENLANERKVIFYDQLGCGNSQKSDRSFWTVEYFVEELGEVVKSLRLKNFHLFGHSWGAGLAVAFALTKPKGLKSLILSDPYISTPHWEKSVARLLKELPKNMQDALKSEDFDSKEYKKASDEFYYRFLYRQKNLSVASLKAEFKMNIELYNYMWGPSEFNASGTLKKFDLSPRLSEIKAPVLLLCGRFDEATPESTEQFKNLLPNARIKVFEKSAHMPHWTEQKEYLATISKFLSST